MDSASLIFEYFPELTSRQREQFNALGPLYNDWNSKINVISRADMEHFYERHVLHSLAISKFISFNSGSSVLDVGTGGGFPGIPLAIMFPEANFVLVDSIGKKIKVVESIAETLELTNVKAIWGRAEAVDDKFDFVVSRAVTALDKFIPWVKNKFYKGKVGGIQKGILYLRGDIDESVLRKNPGSMVKDLSDWYAEPFFETKKLVYIPVKS